MQDFAVRMTAIALTIAGSDSGGGAGIQADLKTFSALGVYGASAITALTAQNTTGVQAILNVPPVFVAEQIRSVMTDLNVRAIKIGMLSTAAIIEAVVDALSPYPGIPVVLDPVMIAASGDTLLEQDAISALKQRLVPLAAVITPNLPEAAAITASPVAANEEDMAAQGRAFLELGAKAVLVKGGHGQGSDSVDILVQADRLSRFSALRIATQNVHGTGCTLSSAIAAGMAKGLTLDDAIAQAKAYITAAIAASSQLSVGQGRGPAHHFHAWWPHEA
jgi:hydroxymethylpyrimidine/phosphomethylpyrimidine kinase